MLARDPLHTPRWPRQLGVLGQVEVVRQSVWSEVKLVIVRAYSSQDNPAMRTICIRLTSRYSTTLLTSRTSNHGDYPSCRSMQSPASEEWFHARIHEADQ